MHWLKVRLYHPCVCNIPVEVRLKPRYSKANVQTHRTGYGTEYLPAVDIKVYTGIEDGDLSEATSGECPEGFTVEWIEAHLSEEEIAAWWQSACEQAWEIGTEDAHEIFRGYGTVETWSEGRSGGWCVVSGLPSIEEWDAVLLAKWRKFERFAHGIRDDVPTSCLSLIYINVWDNPEWHRRYAMKRLIPASFDPERGARGEGYFREAGVGA